MKKGQSLIELILAIGLTAILIPALTLGFVAAREGKPQQKQRLEAIMLLKEAQEATRSVREKGWSQVANNGTYHPVITSGTWSFAANSESINGFTRSIVVSDTYRDSNGNIVLNGTLDPSTKKVIITIFWTLPYSSSVTSTSYIARFTNSSYTETSESQFNPGTKTGTVVTNVSGGEVTLGAGGGGDWCNPNLSITAVDLPKNGVANAVAAIEGKAFAGTGDNASGISYASVNISNSDPPAGSVEATFDGYKTNDGIFGETNYAYLATDTNSKEVAIVDLTSIVSGKYSESGYFNAPGNGNANSVYVSNNIGYMTDGAGHLYTFDLSSKSGSRPQLGSIDLAGVGNKVVVSGSYAFVAEAGSTQLEIIQVSSDGRTLNIVGHASLAGAGAKSLFVNSSATRAYFATAISSTQREFFIVDISTKTGSRPTVGSFEADGMNPRGVTVVTGNKALIVGTGGEEYQVINILNETNPVQCGGLNIDSGVNGVASVVESDGDAYSYIITGDASSEFKIIEGGPGGQFATSGTFESSIFDAGLEVSFNRLYIDITEPAQANIQFQVAAADAINNSCATSNFVFVGPDGTSGSYYTASSPIFMDDDGASYENPGRCFKYKGYFTTSDISQTPVFNDMTINYSL